MMDYVGGAFSVIDLPSLLNAHPDLQGAHDAMACVLYAAEARADLEAVDLASLDEISAVLSAKDSGLATPLHSRYSEFVSAVKATTGLDIYRGYIDTENASRYSEVTGTFWGVGNAWVPSPAAVAAHHAGVLIRRKTYAVHC